LVLLAALLGGGKGEGVRVNEHALGGSIVGDREKCG
jgi:hypothetical protein